MPTIRTILTILALAVAFVLAGPDILWEVGLWPSL